jgi:biopolymer transport protein ExbD
MSRSKLPRKSTNIDMTAMCDVAFLLLTFFMLATKFKPEEAVKVQTPYSVSSDKIPDKNAMLVSIDNEGKVYVSFSDKGDRVAAMRKLNSLANIGLSEDELKKFVSVEGLGLPFNQIKPFINLSEEERKKVKQGGIPVLDSTKNELTQWIAAGVDVFSGRESNWLVKGDNASKFTVFKAITEAFKKNDQFKFKLITVPEGAPEGSALYMSRLKETR